MTDPDTETSRPCPAGEPPPPPRRLDAKRVGRLIALGCLVGGIVLWAQLQPIQVVLGFDMPLAVRGDRGATIERAELRALTVRVFDSGGDQVAWGEVGLASGVDGPVTPPVVLRLPRGTYRVEVLLEATGGRVATRSRAFELQEEGYQRVDLGGRPGA